MNFDYTDEQKALKDEARRFLSAVSPLTVVRGALDNPVDGYDAALWSRIGEQGWCGAAIPEEYGGIGMGYVELCALAEELGRALAPVPFASTVYLFAEALLLAGSEAQKRPLARSSQASPWRLPSKHSAASRFSRWRSSRESSTSVPGVTTRTTCRSTGPLDFAGSPTCSQMATDSPRRTRRAR